MFKKQIYDLSPNNNVNYQSVSDNMAILGTRGSGKTTKLLGKAIKVVEENKDTLVYFVTEFPDFLVTYNHLPKNLIGTTIKEMMTKRYTYGKRQENEHSIIFIDNFEMSINEIVAKAFDMDKSNILVNFSMELEC